MYMTNIFAQTNMISCMRNVYVCVCTYIHMIYFRKITNVIWGDNKSKICRVGQQAGNSGKS